MYHWRMGANACACQCQHSAPNAASVVTTSLVGGRVPLEHDRRPLGRKQLIPSSAA